MQKIFFLSLGVTALLLLVVIQLSLHAVDRQTEGLLSSDVLRGKLDISPSLIDSFFFSDSDFTNQHESRRNHKNSSKTTTHTNSSDAPILYFLHLQKTGGTTIKDLIQRNMKRVKEVWPGWLDYQNLASAHSQRIRSTFKDKSAVIGHYLFGLHDMLPGRRARYITILRDPFDRLISLYNWHKKQDEGENDIGSAHLGTVRGFLRSDHRRFLVDNHLVRVICGPTAFFQPEGKINELHLECAKKNLQTFDVVMILEEYETSLRMAEDVLGFQKLDAKPSKVVASVRGAEASELIEEEDRVTIQSFIKWDRELYTFGKRLFCGKLKELKISHGAVLCGRR